MPRKNVSQAKNKRGGRRRTSRADQLPIDWDRAEALHAGRDERDRRAPQQQAHRKEKPHNEFIRHLTGFGDKALGLMLEYGFEHVDEAGFVPVKFLGVSKKPRKKISYERPGVVITRGGMVVVSGMVGKPDRDETGLGTGNIEQVDTPSLNSHNSATRLNVSLGRERAGIKEHQLAKELLGDAALMLSRVIEINGQVVEPDFDEYTIGALWNRPPEPSPGLGYSEWDEPYESRISPGYW